MPVRVEGCVIFQSQRWADNNIQNKHSPSFEPDTCWETFYKIENLTKDLYVTYCELAELCYLKFDKRVMCDIYQSMIW